MHQRKSKKILVYFFLLLVISSTNSISLSDLKFYKVQDIKITGLSINENRSLLNKIKKINLENVFFINKNEISSLIDSNSLIENYEIKHVWLPGTTPFY